MKKEFLLFNSLPTDMQRTVIMQDMLKLSETKKHKRIQRLKSVSKTFKQEIFDKNLFIKLIQELFPIERIDFKPIVLKPDEEVAYWQKIFCDIHHILSLPHRKLFKVKKSRDWDVQEFTTTFVRLLYAVKHNDILQFKQIVSDEKFEIQELFVQTNDIEMPSFRIRPFSIIILISFLKRQPFLDYLYQLYSGNPERWVTFMEAKELNALHIASILGQLEPIKKAVEDKTALRRLVAGEMSPLTYATIFGQVDIVSLILQSFYGYQSVDLIESLHLLNRSIRNGYPDTTKLLLSYDIDPNKSSAQKSLPLLTAVRSGDYVSVTRLLEKPSILVNLKESPQGISALWVAVKKGNIPIATLLLSKGANVNTADYKYGASPLWIACDNNDVEMAQVLLEHGANANQARTDNPISPLFKACSSGNEQLVRLLLQHGADINFVDKSSGETPIFYAIHNHQLSVVKLLLSRGASVDIKSRDGQTPLTYAQSYDSLIAEILKVHKQYAYLKLVPDYKLYQLILHYRETRKNDKSNFGFFYFNGEIDKVLSELVTEMTLKPWERFNGKSMMQKLVNIADKRQLNLTMSSFDEELSAIIHWAESQFNFKFDDLKPKKHFSLGLKLN